MAPTPISHHNMIMCMPLFLRFYAAQNKMESPSLVQTKGQACESSLSCGDQKEIIFPSPSWAAWCEAEHCSHSSLSPMILSPPYMHMVSSYVAESFFFLGRLQCCVLCPFFHFSSLFTCHKLSPCV